MRRVIGKSIPERIAERLPDLLRVKGLITKKEKEDLESTD